MVTYGVDLLRKSCTVKTPFLVLPCKSIYKCIIGQPTLGRLGVVAATVHLKMKFFPLEHEVITLDTERGVQSTCYQLATRSL